MITSLYSLSRRRTEYRLVITKPEATNCFSINLQVFTNNNQHNFILVKLVETPRKFIIAELSIRKLGSSPVLIILMKIRAYGSKALQ